MSAKSVPHCYTDSTEQFLRNNCNGSLVTPSVVIRGLVKWWTCLRAGLWGRQYLKYLFLLWFLVKLIECFNVGDIDHKDITSKLLHENSINP